jgi:hypothetical protein
MPNSDNRAGALDFDRDLPTTEMDIEALRRCRPSARFTNLKNMNELTPPEWFEERKGVRQVFGDLPPFEL